MAVASKSVVSSRKRQNPSKARAVAELNSGAVPLSLKALDLPSRPRPSDKTVPIQVRAGSAPLWLLRLCTLQRRSWMISFLLMAGMLAVYSWTVYSQKMWSQSYRKLETLQRNERQLTATSEVLKNEIALQAEKPATGLVPPNPASAIFLPPAQERPAANTGLPAPKPATQTQKRSQFPLGY